MENVNADASAGVEEQAEKIRKLMELVKNLNAEDLEDVLSYAEKYYSANESDPQCCPYCVKTIVIRYGRKHGKQRYLCKSCYRTFVSTVNSVMCHSCRTGRCRTRSSEIP